MKTPGWMDRPQLRWMSEWLTRPPWHWLKYSSRWWWAKDPKVGLLLAFAAFSFSRMLAYLPSLHPEVLTYGLMLVSSFLSVPIYAGIWGLSGCLLVYLAFSRSWFPPAMAFVAAPPGLWAVAYLVSTFSDHATPRDGPTAGLYFAMAVAYITGVLIPPQVGGWQRQITVNLIKKGRSVGGSV